MTLLQVQPADPGFKLNDIEKLSVEELPLMRARVFCVSISRRLPRNNVPAAVCACINEPQKNWKFSAADLKARTFWSKYVNTMSIA